MGPGQNPGRHPRALACKCMKARTQSLGFVSHQGGEGGEKERSDYSRHFDI